MIDRFDAEAGFLSNFAPSPIAWRGVTWATVEAAFQAAKTDSPEEAEKIRRAATPGKAKRLGRKVVLRSGWEAVKIPVMLALVRLKFAQNPALAAQLVATANQELVEGNSWGDTFWGVCDGEGRNELGKILMLVRSEIAGTPGAPA